MNAKATVSKELDAKHLKILDDLLKLRENRECADCKTRGPRWASVNLGIFICMQCSGIHRSLGVHISKVRSATLDTWLPDQVAFIQSMGNERSNSYWEAELPRKYDRVGIENFIRAKYKDKRWIPRDGKSRSPSSAKEEKVSIDKSGTEISRGILHTNCTGNFREAMKKPLVHKSISSEKANPNVTPKVSEQVNSDLKRIVHQKLEPANSKAELETKVANIFHAVSEAQLKSNEANTTTVASELKVDYATDLFNLLAIEKSTGNISRASSFDNKALAIVHPIVEQVASKDLSSNAKESSYGFDDIFKGLEWVVQPITENPLKDEKNDVLNNFEESNMPSPFRTNQQHPVQAQQASLYMTVAAHSQPVQQQVSNGVRSPAHQMDTTGNKISCSLAKTLQIGSTKPSHPMGDHGIYQGPSMNRTRPQAPMSSLITTRTSKPRSKALSIPTQLGGEYDFSSLTQGLFAKR